MNREEIKQLLPIINAFAAGDIIELMKSDGSWSRIESISFTLDSSRYRIKPELRERWLATPTALGLIHNPDMREELCNVPTWNPAYWTFILMREVEKP